MPKAHKEEVAERSLRGANQWNEVKDRLNSPGNAGRPAAAAVHRPRDRDQPEVLLMDEPARRST